MPPHEAQATQHEAEGLAAPPENGTSVASTSPGSFTSPVSFTSNEGWLTRAPVLVLNLNYVPVNVCTVRRAIILLAKGKAEILENRQEQLRTVAAWFEAPSIIRLVYLVKRPFLPRKLSKREVFLRDRFTCQYCGKKNQDLTLDHVIPRRQNGSHAWNNVVAACSKCNLRKAGRTPKEASMSLVKEPRAPDPNPYLILQNRSILEEWRPYIPWNGGV